MFYYVYLDKIIRRVPCTKPFLEKHVTDWTPKTGNLLILIEHAIIISHIHPFIIMNNNERINNIRDAPFVPGDNFFLNNDEQNMIQNQNNNRRRCCVFYA